MKKGSGISVVILLAVLFLVNTAFAELFNRGTDSAGNQLIYDSDLNITWYDYTKSGDTWQNQVNWAGGLDIDFGGTHYTDWRLPSTVDGPDVWGYNITSSGEMGHLFYTELGNKGYCDTSGNCPQPGWGLTNKAPFINLQPSNYWSGTELAADPGLAWSFGSISMIQVFGFKCCDGYVALAVRPGDVAVVPEPISAILFIAGGAVLASRRWLKRKR